MGIVTLIQKATCSICGYPMRAGLQAWMADNRDYECQDCSVIQANYQRYLMYNPEPEPIRHQIRATWQGYNAPHKWSREAQNE